MTGDPLSAENGERPVCSSKTTSYSDRGLSASAASRGKETVLEMTILFVCTGNTCRSPMAAALMRRALDKRGRADIIVESAGFAACSEPASPHAVEAMAEYGIDLSAHRSRRATEEMLRGAELVAVMSPSHAFAALSLGADPAKIRVLAADEGGVADPYGGDLAVYRCVRDQLEREIERLAAELTGAPEIAGSSEISDDLEIAGDRGEADGESGA